MEYVRFVREIASIDNIDTFRKEKQHEQLMEKTFMKIKTLFIRKQNTTKEKISIASD